MRSQSLWVLLVSREDNLFNDGGVLPFIVAGEETLAATLIPKLLRGQPGTRLLWVHIKTSHSDVHWAVSPGKGVGIVAGHTRCQVH